MLRGTCENCVHDTFRFSTLLTLGRNVFICMRCPPRASDENEYDEREWEDYFRNWRKQ